MAVRRLTLANVPFVVKKIELETDLRTMRTRSESIHELVDKYHLNDGEAICFMNRVFNRCRIIWKREGMCFLVIPEVDIANIHEMYLKVTNIIMDWSAPGSDAFQKVTKLDSIKRAALAAAK